MSLSDGQVSSLSAPRSSGYLFFGAVPATLLLVGGVLGLSMAHATVAPAVFAIAGSMGTWGLWNASRTDSKRSKKELMWLSVALAIGLLLLLPIATLFSYGVYQSLAAGKSAFTPWFTMASSLFGAWACLGPVAVSVHFLWREWR